MVLIVLHGLNG